MNTDIRYATSKKETNSTEQRFLQEIPLVKETYRFLGNHKEHYRPHNKLTERLYPKPAESTRHAIADISKISSNVIRLNYDYTLPYDFQTKIL